MERPPTPVFDALAHLLKVGRSRNVAPEILAAAQTLFDRHAGKHVVARREREWASEPHTAHRGALNALDREQQNCRGKGLADTAAALRFAADFDGVEPPPQYARLDSVEQRVAETKAVVEAVDKQWDDEEAYLRIVAREKSSKRFARQQVAEATSAANHAAWTDALRALNRVTDDGVDFATARRKFVELGLHEIHGDQSDRSAETREALDEFGRWASEQPKGERHDAA